MGKTKANIEFSENFLKEGKAIENAHKQITQHLIAETKATNSYLVVADKDGKVKKIPAKDL